MVQLIDFAHPERNHFHAINQFRIDTPGCVKSCIIPDIVLFVNGIPLVVVEAKIGDANTANPMHEAFEQLLRYRNGRPETTKAGPARGRAAAVLHATCCCPHLRREGRVRHASPRATSTSTPGRTSGRRATERTRHRSASSASRRRLIQGLLAPATLLDVLRTCTVFMDTDVGQADQGRLPLPAVPRRPQDRRAPAHRQDAGSALGRRLAHAGLGQVADHGLRRADAARVGDLEDFKILLVNDRVDLEEQLAGTAKLIGGKVNVIESTAQLREHLSTDASDVNMVMVHKFTGARRGAAATAWLGGSARPMPIGTGRHYTRPSKTFGVVNPSERILLMIDEAHRTQGSDLGDNLFEAFPNATRIAFTGTPLITEQHGTKRTVKRFGEYIDTYKLMDAVHDGATLQILYEGRTADTALKDKHGFDTKFEDLFKERSEEELLAIKKKYGATGDILEAEKRIEAIARDLVDHYIDNILPDGFKAQVVCHSKLAAIRYQKAIREALAERARPREGQSRSPTTSLIRRIEFLKAAVVVFRPTPRTSSRSSPRRARKRSAGMRSRTSASPSTSTTRTRR